MTTRPAIGTKVAVPEHHKKRGVKRGEQTGTLESIEDGFALVRTPDGRAIYTAIGLVRALSAVES